MRVEFINPFVQAAFSVLKSLIGADASRGELSLKGKGFLSPEVTITAGVVGMVEGTVFYGMAEKTALAIAGQMMGGMEIAEFDELAKSAVSELANMITGNAATGLSEAGFECDITPPTVVEGREVKVTTVERTLCIPVDTDHGAIEIIVGLQEAKQT